MTPNLTIEADKSESKQFSEHDLIEAFREAGKDSEFRYAVSLKKWYAFKTNVWVIDCEDDLYLYFLDFLKGKNSCDHRADKIIRSAINILSKYPDMKCGLNDFDKRNDFLNCRNGIVDLNKGKFLSHETGKTKPFLITRLADVEYDKSATCPVFEKFIADLFEKYSDKEAVTTYIQQILGYFLSGYTHDQTFFFFNGSGANGKSTLVELLKSIMGDYSMPLSKSLFVKSNSKIDKRLYMELIGRRFININEFEEKDKLNENMLKQLSGNDTMRLEFNEETIEWRTSAKYIGVTNNLPKCVDQSHSVVRRLRIIPFTNTFYQPDVNILEKLMEEKAGILNRLIKGCQNAGKNSKIKMPLELYDASFEAMEDTVIRGDSLLEQFLIRSRSHVLTTEEAKDFLLSMIDDNIAVKPQDIQPHLIAIILKKYASKVINMGKKYQKIYVGVGLCEANSRYDGKQIGIRFRLTKTLWSTHIDAQIEMWKKYLEEANNTIETKSDDALALANKEEAETYIGALQEFRKEIYPES